MKKSIIYSLVAFLLVLQTNLQAQESGKVIYETIVQYNFKPAPGKVEWNAFIVDLPKTGTSVHSLSFDEADALFSVDVSHKEAASPKLNRAIGFLNRGKGPQVESLEVFYDFDKNKKYEQVEFMTRLFIVESEMEAVAWKITGKMKKVMDYVCMGAELKEGDDTITAWFSSEIPVSAGPGIYRGLPGLILGIEKNGEVVSLATAVDFKAMEKSTIKKPKDGKKVTQVEFDKIVAEKREEFKKAGKANSDKRG
jgi:GLPGLI family protein